jgi:O-antigen ligase
LSVLKITEANLHSAFEGEARASALMRRVVQVGLYLILLAPLLTWSGFLMPHVTAKVLGFQILVELVSAATVIWILSEMPSLRRKPRLLGSPIIFALAAFLSYSFLAALVGVDLNLSLWGFIDRQDGLVLLLHFFAWIVVAAWYFARPENNCAGGKRLRAFSLSKREPYCYLFFSFWVSAAVAVTVLMESNVKFDGILNTVRELLFSPLRPGGAFGNPTFLGPYLLFHFFLGLNFLLTAKNHGTASAEGGIAIGVHRAWLPRLLFAVALAAVVATEILILVVLLAGKTRGVFLGLIAGLVFCMILLALGSSSRRMRRTGISILITCFFLAAFFVWRYRDSSFISRIPVLQRLTQLATAPDQSTVARLLTWGVGIRAISDHPILGWGYDNAYYALNKYYDPRLISSSPLMQEITGTWFDKSHNHFIDLAVERGIIGVLLYLLLLGITAKGLYRMSDRRLAICLAGWLISYLIANAVAFDVFGSLFGFFLSLSVIVSLTDQEPLAWRKFRPRYRRIVTKLQKKRQPICSQSGFSFKTFPVLVVTIICVYFQVEIGIANHKCLQARTAFSQDPGIGVSLYREAFEHFSPYNARQKLDCAYLIVSSVIKKRPSSQAFDASSIMIQLIRDALASHPQDVNSYIMLNDMYNGLVLNGNRALIKDAEVYGKKALELSPKRQEAMLILGRTYLLGNESNRAVELNRRMIQDADFPLGHWVLGLSLLQNNQRDEAKKEIARAIKMGYIISALDITMLKSQLGDKEGADLAAGK